MNGKFKTLILILTLTASVVAAYFTTEIKTAEKLGDKPSRQELKESIRESQEQTQRQLDNIQKQQDRIYEEIKGVNQDMMKLLHETRRNR